MRLVFINPKTKRQVSLNVKWHVRYLKPSQMEKLKVLGDPPYISTDGHYVVRSTGEVQFVYFNEGGR